MFSCVRHCPHPNFPQDLCLIWYNDIVIFASKIAMMALDDPSLLLPPQPSRPMCLFDVVISLTHMEVLAFHQSFYIKECVSITLAIQCVFCTSISLFPHACGYSHRSSLFDLCNVGSDGSPFPNQFPLFNNHLD